MAPMRMASRASGVEATGVARGHRLRAPKRSDAEILRGLADRTICGSRLSRTRLLELESAGLLQVQWLVEGRQRWIGKIVITLKGARQMETAE